LDRQVRVYLATLRDARGVVDMSFAIAGIVRRHERNLLAVNGGYIVLKKHWPSTQWREWDR